MSEAFRMVTQHYCICGYRIRATEANGKVTILLNIKPTFSRILWPYRLRMMGARKNIERMQYEGRKVQDCGGTLNYSSPSER